MKNLVNNPSIPAQIFRGFAYVAIGSIALSILFFISRPTEPKGFLPPTEGFNLKYIWMALFQYVGEHDFQYPNDLQSIAHSSFITEGDPKWGDILSSPNLIYYPPANPIRNPYSKDNKDTILLTYETNEWIFSISVGSELKYHRKKIE